MLQSPSYDVIVLLYLWENCQEILKHISGYVAQAAPETFGIVTDVQHQVTEISENVKLFLLNEIPRIRSEFDACQINVSL